MRDSVEITQDVRLDLLVAEAVERAQRHASEKRFTTDLQPSLVLGVPGRLVRAVANLLVNYFLSVNSARFIAPLLGAGVLETVLMTAFHRDVGQFLAMLLVTTAVLAVSLAGLYAIDRFRV